MKAVMTVIGADCIGIVAQVSTLLAKMNVNILDMSQTIMEGLFTMTMLVDTEKSEHKLEDTRGALDVKGAEMGLKIRIQRADIFTAMHRI